MRRQWPSTIIGRKHLTLISTFDAWRVCKIKKGKPKFSVKIEQEDMKVKVNRFQSTKKVKCFIYPSIIKEDTIIKSPEAIKLYGIINYYILPQWFYQSSIYKNTF